MKQIIIEITILVLVIWWWLAYVDYKEYQEYYYSDAIVKPSRIESLFK